MKRLIVVVALLGVAACSQAADRKPVKGWQPFHQMPRGEVVGQHNIYTQKRVPYNYLDRYENHKPNQYGGRPLNRTPVQIVR